MRYYEVRVLNLTTNQRIVKYFETRHGYLRFGGRRRRRRRHAPRALRDPQSEGGGERPSYLLRVGIVA